MNETDWLSIGAVAQLVGRSASTIRRMEARGIVTPARLAGKGVRRYSPADVAVIRSQIDERVRKQPVTAITHPAQWYALVYRYLRGAVDGGPAPGYTLAEWLAEAEFYASEYAADQPQPTEEGQP